MELLPSAHRGLMSLVLTCVISFLFNRASTRVNPETFRLRGMDDQVPKKAIAPLIEDFELTPSAYLNYGDPSGDVDDEPSMEAIVPECARDVFLELRREDGDENEERQGNCRGMLIRDDIILTSKRCSQFKFSFDFPDGKGKSRRADPLKLNEEKEKLTDPRLGFLKTNAPSHYYFADQPVMRTRMLLSLESSPGIAEFEDGAVIFTCDGHKPVAHNFRADGELVPLGHLSEVVPRDVLWKERDAESLAPALEDDSGHRWWTRAVTRHDEERTIKRLLEDYSGPPGSVSIPKAHEGGFVSQVGGLCEAVDPRGHRRQDCFKNYYFRWRNAEPFGGAHFFDWLDFGDGKFLMERNDTREMIIHVESDHDCFKNNFNRKKVHYFNDDERRAHEVYLTPSEEGREIIGRYRQSDEVVPRSPPDYSHLYMWDLEGRFYVVDHTWDSERYGTIKHTAVLAGRPALSAGKVLFGKHGRLVGINWSSGHYRPTVAAPSLLYRWMQNEGLNVTALDWIGRTSWTEESCGEEDWGGVRVPGYESAESLEGACREVTTGPTWRQKEDDRR